MVQTYIGAPIRRKEDARFLTGRATFVDDIKLPNMLHAAILRSPHAHARIKGIDATKALAIPGVVAVYTFEDIASLAGPIPVRTTPLPELEPFLQYPLASDVARYVGDPVAVVIAESRYLAEDGLDAVEVIYEPLQVVTNISESLREQVLVHEAAGTNVAAQYTFSTGDIDEAFRAAEYTRKEEFKLHRHTGNPLETRGLAASYDANEGELTVWGPTKVPYFNRGILTSFLGIPADKIHLIQPDAGGGFGIRGEFYPEDFLIPFAAIRLGRPVKWVEDRLEHLMAANHSRDVFCEIEVAAKRDGTLLGIRADICGDMGGYIRTHGASIASTMSDLLTGQYFIPAYQCAVKFVMTNKMGLATYRGPGFYEACFARERLLDMVAADLGIDPAEIRLRNFIQPSQMPYDRGKTRQDRAIIFDSGDYPMALKRALDEIGYEELKPLQGRHEDGKYHGIGIGCFVEYSGIGPYEGARIVVRGADEVAIYVGVPILGQGIETVMAQICADGLSVPIESIEVYHGNTDYMPRGVGTFASRVTVMTGNAIHLACQELRGKVLDIAASYLDTEATGLELENGKVYRKGAHEDGPLLGLDDIVSLAAPTSPDSTEGPGLDATAYFESDLMTFGYGSHIAHVAVDPETGKLDILRYVMVDDIGRCINPLLAHGQLVGAAAQGIGGTILEEMVYDDNGQLLSGTLMDYLLPTSRDVPNIESIILEEAPSPLNPLGVKGAGESGIVATGAALANAVANALGVEIRTLPLSPNKIKEWIDNKG